MLEELAIEKEEELINTVGKRASNRIKSSDVTPGEIFLFFNEKILPLVHILTDNYQKIFAPGPDIVVDETIVS
ncbi:hypothetical protein HZH68_012623 [Vespula germanica]|uniref:Uncharacterized protein n=1 Tax=Vespula germanica TaxID=30212 RepID=A0A834JNP6_VESGE|nr:hypothetical protein HZH68_012623 [Vespula germanica]